MKWRWEYLTVSEFEDAREKAERVAMIPIGSLETHGPHLPLGNDGLKIEKIADMVAQIEPVVVLPTLFYTQSYQAKLLPGALCIHSDLLTALLENICDEAYRNGFEKIVLLHGHGGNTPVMEGFLRLVADKAKPYAVYSIPPWAGLWELIDQIKETEDIGHACEMETSIALFLIPDAVNMEAAKGKIYKRREDLDVAPASTPVDWIANWPEGPLGNPSKATLEKGEKLVKKWVEVVVDSLRRIKKDKVVPELMRKLREVRYGKGGG
ncbi:creatininase family protein [bacterium]|nr:creatininase family protein [bacterium]